MMTANHYFNDRSHCSEVFCEKGVLKDLAKETLAQVSFAKYFETNLGS